LNHIPEPRIISGAFFHENRRVLIEGQMKFIKNYSEAEGALGRRTTEFLYHPQVEQALWGIV